MEQKQHTFNAKHPLKSKKIYKYDLKHLRKDWSPEQIAVRVQEVTHKGDPYWQRGGNENCNL